MRRKDACAPGTLGVALGFAATLAAAPAAGADRIGRMTVEIKVEGAQSWKAPGGDHGNAKISEYYRIVTHVKSTGELTTVNTMDPNYAQTQIAKAAAVQRRVAQMQGQPAAAVPRTPAEQQAFMAKIQQEQQACGSNTQCLMAVATKHAPTMNAMAMQAMGGAAAPAGADEVDLDAPEDERFLDYFGYEGCPTEIEIRIDNSAEGAYADVGGMVPWKESDTADYRGNDLARKMQCLNQQTVYDVKDRKIHTRGFGTPQARGHHKYWDRLHGDKMLGDSGKETDINGNSEALAWVAEQLRQAPASGSLTRTLAPQRARGGVVTAGATNSGEIKVSLSWKFEPDVSAKK